MRVSGNFFCHGNFELKKVKNKIDTKTFNSSYITIAGWEEVFEVEEGNAAHIDGDGKHQEGRVNHFDQDEVSPHLPMYCKYFYF